MVGVLGFMIILGINKIKQEMTNLQNEKRLWPNTSGFREFRIFGISGFRKAKELHVYVARKSQKPKCQLCILSSLKYTKSLF
jgi:hypothetical protein